MDIFDFYAEYGGYVKYFLILMIFVGGFGAITKRDSRPGFMLTGVSIYAVLINGLLSSKEEVEKYFIESHSMIQSRAETFFLGILVILFIIPALIYIIIKIENYLSFVFKK